MAIVIFDGAVYLPRWKEELETSTAPPPCPDAAFSSHVFAGIFD